MVYYVFSGGGVLLKEGIFTEVFACHVSIANAVAAMNGGYAISLLRHPLSSLQSFFLHCFKNKKKINKKKTRSDEVVNIVRLDNMYQASHDPSYFADRRLTHVSAFNLRMF